MKCPILVYLDPNKPYSLFMNGSKKAWSAVLTQEHTSTTNGKTLKPNTQLHTSVDYWLGS